jgi:tripartite-type tricarboxylate transporter receptor subunit TctC
MLNIDAVVIAAARVLAIVALVPAATAVERAQEYPNRLLRDIVPFPPGGAVDLVTRIVTPKLSEVLGQSIVVENRAGGAGGTVGADLAAKATPDGYTLFTCQIASHAISPALYKKLPYNHIRDLVPISLLGTTPNVLSVHPSVPVKSVSELIAWAKASPGKINYASPGIGTSPHLTMELFKLSTGINLVNVPYKGGAPALADLLGGHVVVMFANLPEHLPSIKAGRLRGLAVSSAERAPQLPDVPTVAESGVAGFEVTVWYGLCTPAGVPKPIVAKLNAAVVKTLNFPEVKERLAQNSIKAESSTPEQFAAHIKSETAKWAKVVKDAGVTVE